MIKDFLEDGWPYYHSHEDTDWTSKEVSPKAWMSVRDADLLEGLIIKLASRHNDMLTILEWGSGQSTLWYTGVLNLLKISYQWISIEHNRSFFDLNIKSEVSIQKNSTVIYSESWEKGSVFEAEGVFYIVFNYGNIAPFDSGILEHCYIEMEDYILFPNKNNIKADLVIVDGRKRRRCLLEAHQIVTKNGYVLLHDSWRDFYHSACGTYNYSTRFGDDWWIGCEYDEDFKELLPEHALGKHSYFSRPI